MKLKIKSSNRKLKSCLTSLFNDVLHIDLNYNMWLETMEMYGDLFLLLNVKEKEGIVNIMPLPSYEVLHIAAHKSCKTKKAMRTSILKQLRKAAVLHLYSQGFKQNQLTNFKLNF